MSAKRSKLPPGLRLYRLPERFFDGVWCVYDGTSNTIYSEVSDLCDELHEHDISLDEDDQPAVDAFVKALRPAKARSWLVNSRSSNAANNAGYRAHVAWDPVARHGCVSIKSYVTSDADVEFTSEKVTFEEIVKEAKEAAASAQEAADYGSF